MISRIIRQSSILTLAYAVSLIGWTSSAYSAEVEWKLHIVQPGIRQEAIAAQTFANRVNERTAGELKITVYPGGALGVRDPDMLRVLPRGNVIQAALLTPAYISRDTPEMSFVMPEGVMKAPNDTVQSIPVLREFYDQVLAERGVKHINILMAPTYKLGIFCKEPVNTLADLRRKKLRVWSRFLAETFTALGVSPSLIPQSELYVAMQTGVVDCATYYLDAANTTSLNEVAPYWSEIAIYPNPMALVASQAAWDQLPEAVRAVMEEEAAALSEELIEGFLEDTYETAEAEKYARGGGEELERFPAEDRDAYLTAAREIWATEAEKLGEPTISTRAKLLELLEE